ncbi:MAG TPA: hypothetical protein VI959_01685 [Alphaproteobacteria bacterium]|nr:hypothetical protein [Alphaproteobacteria bacterium]
MRNFISFLACMPGLLFEAKASEEDFTSQSLLKKSSYTQSFSLDKETLLQKRQSLRHVNLEESILSNDSKSSKKSKKNVTLAPSLGRKKTLDLKHQSFDLRSINPNLQLSLLEELKEYDRSSLKKNIDSKERPKKIVNPFLESIKNGMSLKKTKKPKERSLKDILQQDSTLSAPVEVPFRMDLTKEQLLTFETVLKTLQENSFFKDKLDLGTLLRGSLSATSQGKLIFTLNAAFFETPAVQGGEKVLEKEVLEESAQKVSQGLLGRLFNWYPRK